MTDRIAELESLAEQKASGAITAEEFASRKAEVLGTSPEKSTAPTDDDIQRGWSSMIGLIGIAAGVALFYFNGWAIGPGHPPYGIGTDLGFYVGPYSGAYALFVRIGESWIGLARSNTDALLFDAPLLNAIGLVAALVFGFEGFKSFMWPERHQRDDAQLVVGKQ